MLDTLAMDSHKTVSIVIHTPWCGHKVREELYLETSYSHVA